MRTRCGKCPACLTPDCGKCEPCSKKKKFGGDGSSKHACIFRRCTNLQVNVVHSSNSNGGGGRRKRSNSSSSSHGKAVPTTTKTKSSASSPDDKWHVHPRSLLASRLPKRARIAAGETAFDENSPPTLPSHFSGLPIPGKTLGVCARCKNPSEDAHEPVLLCDGEGYVPIANRYWSDNHPAKALFPLVDVFRFLQQQQKVWKRISFEMVRL